MTTAQVGENAEPRVLSRGLRYPPVISGHQQKVSEEPMPAAYFVVRATVTDAAKRKAFDRWYQTEHMPDAAKSFGVKKAWRFWSLADPSIHQATYQFDDEASLDRAMKGEDMKRLVADFNRDWPDVTRTRETFVLAEEFAA
jgi:hypothetical protein